MAKALSYPERTRVEEIYCRTKYIIFGTAKEILRDNSLAEEALQETFSRFIKNFSAVNCNDERKITNYLITTARYISFDIYNRQMGENLGYEEDIGELTADETEDFTFEAENRVAVKTAIGELDEPIKAVFLLYYSGGYRQEEIAKMLKISRSLVSQRLIKAKKLLKEKLSEKGDA